MDKRFLDARKYLEDCWRLAHRICCADSWRPEVVLGLWRGGAPAALAVHEYLVAAGFPCRSAVIKCSSYTAIGEHQSTVRFEGVEGILATVKSRARVLIVDDVFDSGWTCQAAIRLLRSHGAEPRTATVYWKPGANQTAIRPDYFSAKTDEWLVFPHELAGLSAEELSRKDPSLAALLEADRRL